MIQVTGVNETITISSSQSSTAYTYKEKFPFGIAHSYGYDENAYGFDGNPYGFVEHILKEGIVHVS